MKSFSIVLLFVLVLGFGSQAVGRTWYVAKDGSGDFEVIQDAVDAASDGDVIEIGPGRYDEYQEYSQFTDVFVLVNDKSLTFRGAGPEETIIGPDIPHYRGCNGFRTWGMNYIRFDNLSVENMNLGSCITAGNVAIFESENCVFRSGDQAELPYGIAVDCSHGGYVRNSQFLNLDAGVSVYSPTNGLVIEDCFFSDFRIGVISGWSETECTVRNCDFFGENHLNSVGIQSSVGATTTIESCNISGCAITGISIGQYGMVTVRDCVINQQGGRGIDLGPRHPVRVENNVIISDVACFFVRGNGLPGVSTFHNNHIFREGSGYYVKTWDDPSGGWLYPGEILDMRSNYWGTQDLNEIALWVEDGNDNPDIGYVVDFQPIADGPVSTESKTLDGVKALYR